MLQRLLRCADLRVHPRTTLRLLALLALLACASAATPALSQAVSDPYNYTRKSSFTYQANGMLASETVEPDTPQQCVVTTHSYDPYGNKTGASTANCAGASGLALFDTRQSTSTYDAQTADAPSGRLAAPAGSFATSSKVALTANIADSASHTESREYDPRYGAVTKLTGPNGATLATTWELDAFGRKTMEKRADGTQSVIHYCFITGRVSDTSSNPTACETLTHVTGEIPTTAVRYEHSVSQTHAGAKIGPWARVYYDAAGRKIRSATEAYDGPNQPAGPGAVIVQDSDYNEHGAVVVATQPYFLVTGASTTTGGNNTVGLSKTVYDLLGRVAEAYTTDPTVAPHQPGGSQASITFGTRGTHRASRTLITYNGLQTTTEDDQGRQRKEEKNPDGKTVRVTDAMGAQIVHQHDAFGNLVKTKDPLGNIITVVYDIRGRKLRLEDPDAGATAYCYDAVGQLKAQQTSTLRGNHGASTCPGNSGTGNTAPAVEGWTTLAYDRMGRLTSRAEPEYVTTWYHDRDAGGSTCGPSIGKPCQSTTNHGITRKSWYDSLGRPSSSRTDVSSGPSMATKLSYDATTGRLASQTYPTGVRLSYHYTDNGFLKAVKNDTALSGAGGTVALAAGNTLWQGLAYNAWGKAEQQSYGNGINSRAVFEPQSGRLHQLTAGPTTTNSVVHQRLHWDSVGKLTARIDGIGDGTSGIEIQDNYIYDALGRLTQHQVAGNGTPSVRTVDLQYNALGMLLYKSDVGIYSYPTQGVAHGRPHAVQSISGMHAGSYAYDLNGNATSASVGKWRSISYTSFNLPDSNNGLQGAAGSPQYTWQYDENHARIKEIRVNSQGTRTTWNLHPDNQGGLGFEREEPPSGSASNRHYVSAGGSAIAVIVTEGSLPPLAGGAQEPAYVSTIVAVKLEYWHKDHLGSLIATTNHAGVVTARYSYDPFGKRRSVVGTYDPFGNIVIDWGAGTTAGTDRGYTGHEHLDDVGVVHMNGRVFDPIIARFLQADPFVQEPDNLQNYDRFAYCFNNPATCTDPTGYFSLKKLIKTVAIIAIAWYVPQLVLQGMTPSVVGATAFEIANGVVAYSAAQTMTAAAIGGFAAGAASTGTFQGGVRGAFSGALFAGIGEAVGTAGLSNSGSVLEAERFAGAVAMHGVAGCVTSVMGGAKCGPGALSAAFSKGALPVTGGMEDGLGRAFAHAVIGGTASVLGGGTFANGAQTGAFSYLFNYCATKTTACYKAWATNIGKMATGILGIWGGAGVCTTGLGCALGAPAVITGAANVAEGINWLRAGDEAVAGFNPVKAGISAAIPSANADLAFASLEVLGAGTLLRAPVLFSTEKWYTHWALIEQPALSFSRPYGALPGAAFEAAGAAWDGSNAAVDQSKKKR